MIMVMMMMIKITHSLRWLGGSAVRALDMRLKGPRFNSQLVHY